MRVSDSPSFSLPGGLQDNTLTVPYVNTVHPPLAESLAQCLAVFDGRAVILRCAHPPPQLSRRPKQCTTVPSVHVPS